MSKAWPWFAASAAIVVADQLTKWLVYHRDAVTRLWRGFRRPPGTAAATGPASPTRPTRPGR